MIWLVWCKVKLNAHQLHHQINSKRAQTFKGCIQNTPELGKVKKVWFDPTLGWDRWSRNNTFFHFYTFLKHNIPHFEGLHTKHQETSATLSCFDIDWHMSHGPLSLLIIRLSFTFIAGKQCNTHLQNSNHRALQPCVHQIFWQPLFARQVNYTYRC